VRICLCPPSSTLTTPSKNGPYSCARCSKVTGTTPTPSADTRHTLRTDDF
jgi:hypothetical protein